MKFSPIFIIGLFLFLGAGSTRINAQGTIKETEQLDFAQGLLSRGIYDMAILQCQKFISDFPHSPSLQEAYLSLGEGYFLSQDFQKAVDTFNQFNQLYPNSDQLPVSILRLGQIDIQQKKYDEALKDLTSIDAQKMLKGPMLQSFDFYTGQAYLGKADPAAALDNFQKAAQVEGASAYTANAFHEMGKIYTQTGKYNEALDVYTKSLQLAQEDPLKIELTYKIAEVQFLSGKYADAIKGFGQIIGQYSGSEFVKDALANMFTAYFNLGQYDQLLNEYQKNIKEIKDDETYFAVHISAVQAYIELKEYDQASALLDHVLGFSSLNPQETAKISIKKADILIKGKRYKDGLALLDAHASDVTDNADEASFLKAQGYFGLGDYDHAFNAFENVCLNFPDSRFAKAALLGQAHTRQEMGRFKESQALFLKYYNSQDQPELKSDALFDAIMIAIKAQDAGGVISSAQEYLKSFPNQEKYTDVLLLLADNYGKNKQPKEAVNMLQDYLAKNPAPQRPNSVYFLLGFNQQLSGNNDQALAAYAQVDQQKEQGKFYNDAIKNTAIVYLNQKKEDQAQIYFDRLISQPGQNDLQVDTYVWVCNVYLKEQKFNDVLRIAAQAEKHFSPNTLQEIKYFEAEALRGLGNCDEAVKSYDFVSTSAPKNAYTGSAHIGYGLCLAKANKNDEARQEFQKSLDENPDDYTVTAHARFEMANVEVAQGNFEDALKLYVLVATIYDDDYFCSESLLRAAKILENLKRKEDALKMYSEILDKYKNSKAANEAQGRISLLR